jgi:hypothetical protein
MQNKLKEDKQKVTLYLPQDLHRQLKIRAAVDSETMTNIAQKAIVFYLSHPDVVDQYEVSYGEAHRVYSCPECSTNVVLQEGEMVALNAQKTLLLEDSLTVEKSQAIGGGSQGEGELVPC